MATIDVSYKNAAAYGLPAFEVLDDYVQSNLLAGVEPAVQQPMRLLLADSQTLAAFTVVGLDAAGKLVKAVWNATVASGVKPIGVLLYAATSGTSNTTKYGEVLHTGCFNVGSNDAGADSPLVWDASFNTLAKKTSWPGLLGNPNLIFRTRGVA